MLLPRAMTYVCKSCGTQQRRPDFESPSSFGAELVVWIGAVILAVVLHWLFLIGAFGFSLWRFGARRPGHCVKCRATDVIPVDSPLGRELVEQLDRKIPTPR